jgi:hypothetical protein
MTIKRLIQSRRPSALHPAVHWFVSSRGLQCGGTGLVPESPRPEIADAGEGMPHLGPALTLNLATAA